MALSNYTYFEVRTTGSDTTNSGGFDINSSGFPTDGSITSANTASPVISSASYSFVAGDVGAWVFIKSGTNSIPGWYKIASVNAGAATLIGSIGGAVKVYTNPSIILGGIDLSNSLGCGIAASLSSITFGVDYSQQDAFRYTGNFVVQATTSNIVGSGITINRSWVGNIINLTSVSAGSAISGYYNIVSIGGTVASLDRSAGTAGSASTGYVGGCFLTPGKAAGLSVLGNKMYIKNGVYTIGSTTANVSGGTISTIGGRTGTLFYGYQVIEGYSATRGDKLDPPTLKAGVGVSNTNIITLLNQGQVIDNLIIDGSSNSSIYGLRDTSNPAGATYLLRSKVRNCTIGMGMINQATTAIHNCEFDNNTTYSVTQGLLTISYSTFKNGGPILPVSLAMNNCILANNNTHAVTNPPNTYITNCTFYNNAGNGIWLENNGAIWRHVILNNIFVNNQQFGISANVVPSTSFVIENNYFYNNTSGSINQISGSYFSTNKNLTGDPFVDAANGNFALNSIAGAGLSVKNSFNIYGWPGYLNTSSSQDVGAVQNINSPVVYVNPERAITIKSGTTSRTEYIYLNTTGYTFSSTGLSASYVRAGSARVAIPLVSQTVTGAYTSGGFCEVDATNMPGLYRIDVPNAIFNTGVKTAALEIINTTTNDRQVISYQFSQDQTLDFTQLVPTSNSPNTVGDALNAARAQGFGKWVLSGTALTIYAGDNTTMVKTFTIDSVTNPTSRT
jgi:hypothetical protein